MGLDGVEIVMEIEDRFKVRLPDGIAAQTRTVSELVDALCALLPESLPPTLVPPRTTLEAMLRDNEPLYHPRERVFAIVREIIVEQLGVDASLVTEQARFVQDLGID